MSDLQKTINDVVLQIIRQRSTVIAEVSNEQRLVADLSFSSLDIAQLVAVLEFKLGLDPFATQVAVTNIRTVGDLYTAYQKCQEATCAPGFEER
ncbi:MAG TPA: hypothetical protein VF747_14715 [Blastocatellia bacterium]|jgi:acyl carrier protein